jgi:hypothetical protein
MCYITLGRTYSWGTNSLAYWTRSEITKELNHCVWDSNTSFSSKLMNWPNMLECYITLSWGSLPRTSTLAFWSHLQVQMKMKCCEYVYKLTRPVFSLFFCVTLFLFFFLSLVNPGADSWDEVPLDEDKTTLSLSLSLSLSPTLSPSNSLLTLSLSELLFLLNSKQINRLSFPTKFSKCFCSFYYRFQTSL